MSRTRIFIDTEFTDLLNFDLISISMVCGEDQFYAERSDYDDSLCAAFTREAVLPQLGKVTAMPWDALALAVREWLWKYECRDPVLAFDNVIDFGLLRELLGEIPSWLASQNIRESLDYDALYRYLRERNATAHHALTDALANQYAYEARRQSHGP